VTATTPMAAAPHTAAVSRTVVLMCICMVLLRRNGIGRDESDLVTVSADRPFDEGPQPEG
jgi:hypothetical protein